MWEKMRGAGARISMEGNWAVTTLFLSRRPFGLLNAVLK